MKNYAYLDKGNILHVVTEEETAKNYAVGGKYQVTSLKSDMGYPVENGERLVVYGLEEAYSKGNAGDGIKIDLRKYPGILDLYKSLLETVWVDVKKSLP